MELSEMVVVAVNCRSELVVLEDGTTLPITNFFDEFGEDCDPDDATVIVAGREGFGYMVVELDFFDEEVSIH